MDKDAIKKILWSVALPGFGQLLNKEFAKGVLVNFNRIYGQYPSQLKHCHNPKFSWGYTHINSSY